MWAGVCLNGAPVGILAVIKNNPISLAEPELTQSVLNAAPPSSYPHQASPSAPPSFHFPVIDSDREMREVGSETLIEELN